MSNGYTVFEDRLRIVIATGFERETKNVKTGDMIQVWILRKDLDPITANHTNKDRAICGDCPLRGNNGKGRTCYVTLAQAPLSVWKAWKAWKAGNYPKLTDYRVFAGRSVRFGAYGDPIHIPHNIVREICRFADSWTGYTHQWRNPAFAAYRDYLMASVEDGWGLDDAHKSGWRTFRVVSDATLRTSREIVCVNESKGVQCKDCGLCAGRSVSAKSVVITVHGTGATYFEN